MEHPAYTLSGLCTVGGIIGYSRKGSLPSLVAGLTFGTIYGYSGYLLHKNADWGLELALGASSFLLATGLARSIPTKFKKPLPLVLTVLGGLGSAYYLKKYNEFYPLF
ncbi:transmembrane proteins 14C-domain-containing protein [Scheffersomyces amazonensis]|uniref:transmembrane proteins 14C-domain-containing protein n=1 Tax=Scheffersomyces amazonensis TaxID=1078765 RepID=UPI00315D5166